MEEKSLSDLMDDAVSLSWKLTYSTFLPDATYFDVRCDLLPTTEENKSIISCWADGLCGKFLADRFTGRCSLGENISFDIRLWEDKVKEEIRMMEELLKVVGPPRQITQGELRERGYRGGNAGYTRQEDILFYLEKAKIGLAAAEIRLKEIDSLTLEKKMPKDWFGRWYDKMHDVKVIQDEIKRLSAELKSL